MNSNIFDRLSFFSLFIVVLLLPVFCLPFTSIPVETSKGLLLVVGLVISMIFWAIARFSDGKIILPKSWLLVSGFGVAFAFLLSSLFAPNSQISYFGTMFDIGSFWFIFAGFVLMFMSSVVFRTPKQAKMVLLGTILSSVFVLIFQTFHLFFPKFLSLGLFADKTGSFIGSWNALGLFAGFAGLLFLFVIEFFPISKKEKIVLEVFVLLSLLLAAAVNFSLVWVLLGISSLIIFVYKVSISLQRAGDEEVKKNFPMVSFIVVMISLLFFVSGQYIGGFIPNYLKITNTEISPSFSATMSITKGVISKYPVFGIGPNKFGEAWAMYKPGSINYTQFWDTSFDSGSGLLTTFTATTGVVGILAWLIFAILFLVMGVKYVFSSIKHGVNWEMMAFFILSLYLFISSFFYFTGAVIFLLALAFTGVFVGLGSSNTNSDMEISFLNDHRKSFFSILGLILIVILSVSVSFKYIERLASVSYFGKALASSTEPQAEDNIGKALTLYTNDLYLRTYAQIFLVKLNTIANKGSNLSDTDKADLQTSFNQAISGAQMATTYNPSSYLNYQLLGSVYQTVGALGVKDAYAKALTAYQTASSLNPLNPGLKLAMSGVSAAMQDAKGAKDYANQALALKQDYVEALLTLSQIAKSEGNNDLALQYAQAALSILPADKSLNDYVTSLSNPSPVPPPDTTTTPKTTKTKK